MLGWHWFAFSPPRLRLGVSPVPWLRRTARVACRRAGAPALPGLPHLCAVSHTQTLLCHDNESQQLGGSSTPLPALPARPAVHVHRSALGSPGGHRGGVPGSKTSLRPRTVCQRTLPQRAGKEAGGARDLQSSPPAGASQRRSGTARATTVPAPRGTVAESARRGGSGAGHVAGHCPRPVPGELP